jgi:hypothetical protein
MYHLELLESRILGNSIQVKISITNKSEEVWNSGYLEGAINLVAWWNHQNKKESPKHFIFNDFKPNQKMEYIFSVELYQSQNLYISSNSELNIDLRKEGKYWFRDKLNEQNFIQECALLTDKLDKSFPIIDKHSNKKSLLIETRELNHNEFVIKNTIQKLGDGWGHIIYCNNNNYNQIKNICSTISDDIEIRMLQTELDVNSYNNLCLDINFWNEIDCEKVFVYQTDTFICKQFNDEFLEYDYLGANWSSYNHMATLKYSLGIDFNLPFGNGGLSLRSKSIITSALKDDVFREKYLKIDGNYYFKMEKIPEDVFYSLYTYLNGKYKKDNSDFSIEYLEGYCTKLNYEKIPFGFHKLDKFSDWEQILKQTHE